MGAAPLIETNNTLTRPTGPEYQLVLGEGTYTLRDDLQLAHPPPHPSEAPLAAASTNNPLATTLGPPTAGPKLSVVVLGAPRNPPPPTANPLFRFATGNSLRSTIPPSIEEETQSPKSDAGSAAAVAFGTASYYAQTPSFGDGNPALAAAAAAPARGSKRGGGGGGGEQRAKPKSSITKSNSSFVSRVIPHEALQKRLHDRSAEGLFAFANISRAFLWLDLSSESKAEQLTKILFTRANPLCHDVDAATKAATHLDVVVGFNTADLIWYEPFSQKYARLNKNGIINPSPVLDVLWLPNKEGYCLAAHQDGTLVVYDREKEDAEFIPEGPPAVAADDAGGSETSPERPPHHSRLRILKSVNSRNQKTNPVAAWKLSTMQISALAFSPDGALLAVVGADGALTILDYLRERVTAVFRSYYGALLCVTWSPDGQYVLTGGQDDLVSIWSLAEGTLVARCAGHQSWVTAVRFDPWRGDERSYRFGSVGEDGRLLLWDFSVGMLGRPKAAARLRGSVSSYAAGADLRRQSTSTVGRLGSLTPLPAPPEKAETPAAGEPVHEVDSKASTAILPPVMSKVIANGPLCWLGFEEHCILTADAEGMSLRFFTPALLRLGGMNVE